MRRTLQTIVLTTLFGCNAMLGLKEPRILSDSEFAKQSQKFNIDTSMHTSLSKEAINQLKTQPYKPNWEVGFRPLQVRMYNGNGSLISQYSTCEGSLKRAGIFNTFPPKNYYPLDSTLTITDELALHRNPPKVKYQENDLTVFVWWASWLGRPMKNLIEETQQYVADHPDKNIAVYYVNVMERQ